MAIEIQKDIPLPNRNGYGEAEEIRNAFKKMKVGESFFLPLDPNRSSFRTNVIYRARLQNIKVTTRKVTENGIDGFRVWRFA